ncbi:MAG: oligoribonuclease [Dermabacter sp.]|nr:oligoribonuclease [Dermabacter sp.]
MGGVTSTANKPGNDRIIWVDCEMTGLDKVNDALIEVAVLVTDADLNVLGEGVDIVIAPPEGALESMGEFVRTMHSTSGLLDDLSAGVSLAEAQKACLDYVREYCPEPGKAPLAGNSVGTDRIFLERDLPEFADHISYRTIDVSSLKELAKRWFPRVFFNTPEKHGGHRALADIRESIQELKYYRDVLFVAPPGPTTEFARATARTYELPGNASAADPDQEGSPRP